MNALKEKYKKEIIPALKEAFGYRNDLAVPHIEKVCLNVGMGQGLKDKDFKEVVQQTLLRITGQKPVLTKARKSISNFKIREGMVVGAKVTLRKDRMWGFLDKLVNVTFPRVRDFRGISPKIVDRSGNLSIGFKEYLAFPEIKPDEVEKLHGLQITIQTTAKNKEEGMKLFELLGFPFKKK